MSRTEDYGLNDAARERPDRSPNVQDRAAEPSSRLGMSHESARVEMERFRGVAEYETRKIFGQRSALRQPVEVPVPQEPTLKKRKTAPAQRPTSAVQRELSRPSLESNALRPEDNPNGPGSQNDHEKSRQ